MQSAVLAQFAEGVQPLRGQREGGGVEGFPEVFAQGGGFGVGAGFGELFEGLEVLALPCWLVGMGGWGDGGIWGREAYVEGLLEGVEDLARADVAVGEDVLAGIVCWLRRPAFEGAHSHPHRWRNGWWRLGGCVIDSSSRAMGRDWKSDSLDSLTRRAWENVYSYGGRQGRLVRNAIPDSRELRINRHSNK